MEETHLQFDESAGGVWGELSTSIDLTKPGDVNLVYRAVVNGWDVPQSIRDQIAAQLVPAIERAEATRNPLRRPHRIIKLCKLMMLMQARNMIDEGHPRSAFPYLRQRHPEKRRPRRRSNERNAC